jgi:hypothetical protein
MTPFSVITIQIRRIQYSSESVTSGKGISQHLIPQTAFSVRVWHTLSVSNSGKLVARIGCLVSIAAPLVALLLYPRARWLFAFPLIGVLILVLLTRFSKDPSPIAVADHAQRLLDGTGGGWDVDDYEHLNPREPQLRELWQNTMKIGGLPEEWTTLNKDRTNELQNIIRAIRGLPQSRT